jgi:hypothetical protein
MDLTDLPRLIPGLAKWSHAELIKAFAWHLQTHKGQGYFTPADIRACYEGLDYSPPSNVGPFLSAMAERHPKEALKGPLGYKLESRVRESFDSRFGQRAATVHVHKLLSELPARIAVAVQRGYLEEALICFRHRAFRGALVMCWNLAFDHLCEFVLAKHLANFNAQLPKSFPRADISQIIKRDDFAELKESQVLQVCRSATIISGSLHKVFKEKLDRRNIAAHPSGVATSELTAEEFIRDLIENAVLKLV